MHRAGVRPVARKPSRNDNAAEPQFSVSDYSPGRIREETDAQASAITAFLHFHPEYAALDHDTIVQAMNVRQRRGRKSRELRDELNIPEGFEAMRSDDCGPSLAEEQ